MRAQCCQFRPNAAIDGFVMMGGWCHQRIRGTRRPSPAGDHAPWTLTDPGSAGRSSAFVVQAAPQQPRLIGFRGDDLGCLAHPVRREGLAADLRSSPDPEVGREQLTFRDEVHRKQVRL